MKIAETIKTKIEDLKKKTDISGIKNAVYTLHGCNKKLWHIPLILFTVLYLFSGIDIIPEAVIKIWISYLDDAVLLIFSAVYFYCSMKGRIRENVSETDAKEGIYSYIISNGGGSSHNIDLIKNDGNISDNNNSGGDDDVCADACSGLQREYEKPNVARIIEEIEREAAVSEPEIKEEEVKEEKFSYAQRYENIKSEDEIRNEFESENRAEGFTISEEEILW